MAHPPSLALPKAPSPGVTILAYIDSDATARGIDDVLSANGIPFYIERAKGHWQGARARLSVTVPEAKARDAQALLAKAAKEGVIEVTKGAEGLDHY